MEDCIFCKIINNQLPSYKIYEDDKFLAFLNIDPNSDGDMLLIPKKHTVNILDLDENVASELLLAEKKLYKLIKEKLNCDGITFATNNEYGQEIKHYHIHITPRYKNEKLEIIYDKSNLRSIENVYSLFN